VDFVAYHGRTLDTVTQAEVLRSFHGVREDLARFEAAASMVGSVRALSGGDEADRRVFNLLYNGLDALERRDSGFGSIEAAFGLKLSMLAGYAPQLDDCLNCGVSLDVAAEPLYFAPNLGGVLCPECRTATGDAFPMPPGTLERLMALIERPIRESLSENGLGEGVLRVVLAHAPGNALPGRARITGSRRPA
jgi:DNA repair protein RecO (recombination protein O)